MTVSAADCSKLSPWRVVSDRTLLSSPFLTVRVESVELPCGAIVDDYYQVDMHDFVAIFAQNREGAVVTLRQYKHGLRRVSLTFPGGQIEDGETPLAAAQRELLEETGMIAERWRFLGSYVVSSNQRFSLGHFFHAYECSVVKSPCSGDLEAAELSLHSLNELFAAAHNGDIGVVNQMTLLLLATHPSFQSFDLE